MSRLVALTCPVCAAPFELDTDRCQYCGAVVFIRSETPRVTKPNLQRSAANDHIEHFRARLRHDYFDAEAHYGLGVVYYNLGLFDAAANELSIASRQMPESAEIQLQLAIVYHEIMSDGNDSVYPLCSQAVANTLMLDPSNIAALALRVELLVDRGDFDGAVGVIDRLVSLDPKAADEPRRYLRKARARYHLENGRWNNGLKIMGRMDAESLTAMLTDFLMAHEPKVFYPVKELAFRARDRRLRNSLTMVVGALLLIAIYGLSELTSILVFLGGTLSAFLYFSYRMQSHRLARRVVIDVDSISAAKSSPQALLTMAHALSLSFIAETITESALDEVEADLARGDQQQARKGCLWPFR